MPGRATVTEAMEDDEEQHAMPGLQFNEALSWRAGKPIAVADLLRRLQALSKELREMDQEQNERASFTPVAKELANPNLLAHKDKGVKAWTACCLVDILRLCAPDAPYTGQQLKDIFNMLITIIIPALADPTNAYNQQHLYVLNSLAQVKSVVLLTDIPNSEKLTTYLFTSFFDILATSNRSSIGEQLGKNVEFNMTSILIIMVDESENLPSEVIDVIVAQFLRTDPRAISGNLGKNKKHTQQVVDDKQSTLMMKELPPSYNMAKTICNSCSEKMARYISQYFNDVIVDASESSTAKATSKKASHRRISDDLDDSDVDIASGPTEEDMRELRKVHQLLRELWRACPAVLQNVIPQLEAELSAENVYLRSLATETFGDIISGIGAAGSPPPPLLDPAAYPPISLSDDPESCLDQNVLTKPSSPLRFSQAHHQAYNSFLSRCHDKSPLIRSAWTTGIGRILNTSAGGVGLSQQEEERLIKDLAKMLGDADEKVRTAAVRAVGTFSFRDVVFKLGSSGGIDKEGSLLASLAERIRDRKHNVRVEAMGVLARLWGVAAAEIAAGDERVISVLGAVPSKILDTYYANDLDIHALLDHVLFEQLLPLSFPPIKKSAKLTNGNSQKFKDSQVDGDVEVDNVHPDKIRTERILILVKNLEERAKKVFFAVQLRQNMLAKVMTVYLQRCENYNGGVMEGNEKEIKEHMARLIENLARTLPESSKVIDHLWKFAKMHDRRSYQLIRFCMAPDSDHRTVFKAFKEITKRIEQSTAAPQDLLNSLVPLLYRVSAIVYNKSHVPAIMEYSRSDEKSLAGTAHELLRDISTRTPEVLKAHVQEICMILQEEAPNANKTNSQSSVDNLKACASFADKFANDVPKDRKFVQAMSSFALHGTPAEAAKHAVTIIMTTSGKKELLATELVQKCVKGFRYGEEGFLSRLATLSQLMLLAPTQVNHESDAVSDIAIEQTLLKVQTPLTESADSYQWSQTVDTECEAKCWALKILVNRIRSHGDPDTLSEIADPVYRLLSTLIVESGEVLPTKDTPPTHKSRLRLLAARLCLKLCTKKSTDALLTPTSFNSLALIAQDAILPVRSSFLQRLKKYLGQQKLPQRFYTIPFLLAFEPSNALKSDTTTWIRSRAAHFYSLKSQQPASKVNPVMESVFSRLVSLLAHHPDYASTAEDLIDFARYILFYLHPVATEENLSLIYHIAQRVKQSRDAIHPSTEHDQNLYHLSDLAQLTIRKFEDAHGWSIQTLPGKIRLPMSLYAAVKDHAEAQRIAERNFLPEGVEEGVEALVRSSMRSARTTGKKRRSDLDYNGGDRSAKKAKTLPIRKPSAKENKKPRSTAAATKTPKRSKVRKSDESEAPSSDRRRSGRVREGKGRYAERDDEEDDEEMGEGVAVWKYEDGGSSEVDEQENEEEVQGKENEEEATGDESEVDTSPAPRSLGKGKRAITAAAAAKGPRKGKGKGR